VRNKVKRRLREIFRKQLKDKLLHYDFVVVARSASPDAEFTDLQISINKIFSRLEKNEETSNNNN